MPQAARPVALVFDPFPQRAYFRVPIIPLYGHSALRARLAAAVARDALPPSLLFQGQRGIGKQRLALWLGQLLLCTGSGERPCERCQNCRYARQLAHPDLRWFFPRPRLSDTDASSDEVLADMADASSERVAANGLYAPPDGTAGIFVSTVRTLVKLASYTPSLASRKVFVIGDAERMVPQEGADMAANAFLKLLEEPPRDTTIILTSSEAGALLPTIRSRVVTLRVPPLAESDVGAFLDDEAVRAALADNAAGSRAERIRAAGGAPGALLAASSRADAHSAARGLLSAATAGRAERFRAAFALKPAQARGFFSEVLDALTLLLAERARNAAVAGNASAALSAERAIALVEEAKTMATGNVNPQLIGTSLVQHLAEVLV